MMATRIRTLLNAEFLRYFAASMVALCVDLSLLLTLANFMHYLFAATLAFLAGTVVHYWLAIHLVFIKRRLSSSIPAEGLVFLGAGVAGLLINAATIYACVEWFAAPLYLAKLVAAGGSFATGFITRKVLLFS